MTYEVVGGPLAGFVLDWRAAKYAKRIFPYRTPTLGESVAWGWSSVVVWDA